MVETASDEILAGANAVDVAFLVVGDPFGYNVLSLLLRTATLRLKLYTVPPHTRTLSCELEN